MSLFDDASLAMIPSAYKDGKLYSIKPTDGSGDFTFTRGSNLAATRVDVNGLIEKGRENLLLQSNQFDTTWATSNTSVTSGQSGYDGSSDAWLLSKTDSNALISQSVSESGVQTYSIYAKAGTLNWCRFLVTASTGNQGRFFNLSNGTKGGSNYGTEIDSTITSVGSGWYRITLTFNESTTSVRIYPADGNLDISGTSGNILIQDAQLEQGLVATDYIETTTTTAQAGILEDMPRLDYSGGASCPSLLLEPQRTNIVLNSEYFGASSWVKQNCTITSNYAISPEGVNNASRIVSSGSFYLYQLFIFTNAVEYTLSFYVKSNGSGNDSFRLYAEGNSTTKTATNEWVRHEYTFTGQGTSKDFGLRDIAGSSLDILIWGAMVEQASYPSSYIPTYGTSQTRSKDECLSSSLTTSTDFTIFFEAKDFCLINGNTGGSYDNVQFVFSPSGSAYGSGGSYHIYNNTLYYYNGSTNTTFGPIYNNQTDSKFALVKRGNQCIIYANGVKKTELTLPSGADAKVINWDAINITPSLADAQGDVFGPNYKQILKFDTALSDSELADLTTL